MNGAVAYDKRHQIHLSPTFFMFTDSLVTTDFCMGMVHHKLQERDLGNFNFPILHLEISLGCKSAGFHLGALGLQKFFWLPKNVRIPKYSYLQALLEKHAVDL